MKTSEMQDLWRYLHEHPERSWEEIETTNYLMDYVKKRGLQPVPFATIPGFSVDIGQGEPVVAIRADMDALYQEVNQKVQANHSCGHDAHMAIVTTVMLRLAQEAEHFTGTLRAIYQPAEEKGGGAIYTVETGVADDIDYLFGLHVRPANEVAFPQCAPAINHGACVFLHGKITGNDHHGARPQEGVNAIEVAYSMLQHIQHVHINPMTPASVKMTHIQAGGKNINIIPGSATFGLDMRAQSNEAMDFLKKRVNDISELLSKYYGCSIELEMDDEVPAAVIHPEAEEKMNQAIMEVLGKEQTTPAILTSGSDDFHFYTLLKPHIKATMLALGADVTPGLHHPDMTFNHDALENGVAVLMEACRSLLKGSGKEK
ncbi:MAG TPA: amidohydrolase [Pseudogracilibacillus sp.]|nr:amidohydrolase [Pseudogracilibacillus sp.]